MRTYIVKNGDLVLSVHDTHHEAREAAQGMTRRIVVREGRHWRWNDAAYWRGVDWLASR